MWTSGQRVERTEVEPWVAENYPSYPYFKAKVEERLERERSLTIYIITLTGPNDEPLFLANKRPCVYFATKPAPGMTQIAVDWVS